MVLVNLVVEHTDRNPVVRIAPQGIIYSVLVALVGLLQVPDGVDLLVCSSKKVPALAVPEIYISCQLLP